MEALKRPHALSWPGKLPRALADLLLPPSCPACGAAVADTQALCAACWAALRFIEPPLCPVYGTPFPHDMGEGTLSAQALADPPEFARARSAAAYDDTARRLVHRMKYHDRPELAQMIAMSMRRAGRELLADCALIIPIPLHRWRLWRRRFNQSAVLAGHLSRLSGVPHDPSPLQRIRPTRRQVGLTAAQREDNMRGAFRVPDAMRACVRDRAILLVDDVYTSGATAKAATRALLKAGAGSVDVLTFARVIHLG